MTLQAGRDVTGRAVLSGDVVAWFRSGTNGGVVFGTVESFTDGGRVRLTVLWSPNGSAAPTEKHTADRGRVVLVEREEGATQLRAALASRIREADDPTGT